MIIYYFGTDLWTLDLFFFFFLFFDEEQSRYKHSRVAGSANFRRLRAVLKHHQQQSPTSCDSPSATVIKMKAEDKAPQSPISLHSREVEKII